MSLLTRNSLVLIFSALLLLGSSLIRDISTEDETQIKLPKFFDFNMYKQMFHKSYGSAAQAIARQKIFTAKALGVFISAIEYRLGLTTYYRGINKFSDLSRSETMKFKINHKLTEQRLRHYGPLYKDNTSNLSLSDPALDESALEVALKRIIEETGPEVEVVKEELRVLSQPMTTINHRNRRHADEVSVEKVTMAPPLKLNDLIKLPKSEEKLSNNVLESELPAETLEAIEKNADKVKSIVNVDPIGLIESIYKKSPLTFTQKVTSSLSQLFKRNFGKQESFAHKKNSYFNWMEEMPECFAPARNQQNCGSCYAIAAIVLMEFEHCRQTGKFMKFSPQYIVDCGPLLGERFDSGLDGCYGGYVESATLFIKYLGLELDEEIPYSGKRMFCPLALEESKPLNQIGYLRPEVNEMGTIPKHLISEALRDGPLSVTVLLPEDIEDYAGGIISNVKCVEGTDHVVILVSEGVTDGVEWYGVLSSWGADYGENGVFKIAKKQKGCLINFYESNVKF